MKYAIVATHGRQVQMEEGKIIILDHIDGQAGDKITFDKVLLKVADEKREIGAPEIAKASVTATIIEHLRGPKIRVAKFKAKSRYRRVQGHRQEQTKIQIETIN